MKAKTRLFISFVYFFFLFIIIQDMCLAQTAIIEGTLNKSDFSNIMIRRFDSSITEQKFEQYKVNKDSFKIKLEVFHPEIFRVYNIYLLIRPNDTLDLKISGNDPTIEALGFNKEFIDINSEFRKISLLLFKQYQFAFAASEYIELIDSSEKNSFNRLYSVYKQYFNEDQEIKNLLENYLLSTSLFLYSLPFIYDTISSKERNILSQLIIEKIISLHSQGYNLRFEDFDVAMSLYFISGRYKKGESFSSITSSSEWNKFDTTLKKRIAGKFIEAYSYNEILLAEEDISLIKSIVCLNDNIENGFCNYYKEKIEYGNLDLIAITKKDYLINTKGSATSFGAMFENKDVHIYLWASWCGPCIQFLKTLDMKKINVLKPSDVVFISIDDDFNEWKKRNTELGLPLFNSFIIKKGLHSDFAQTLKLDHVPFIVDIKENTIIKLNSSKDAFTEFLKE